MSLPLALAEPDEAEAHAERLESEVEEDNDSDDNAVDLVCSSKGKETEIHTRSAIVMWYKKRKAPLVKLCCQDPVISQSKPQKFILNYTTPI